MTNRFDEVSQSQRYSDRRQRIDPDIRKIANESQAPAKQDTQLRTDTVDKIAPQAKREAVLRREVRDPRNKARSGRRAEDSAKCSVIG